ncbi:LOW QUALITY PROTEIN: hypothetical protein JCM19047_2286 [Bacillus sp. JCM 19047]|nr:LOW QUALITY PROTEIN: hypothetical protein JCM19047_2286 [Bacillus sp. JCM 19047]
MSEYLYQLVRNYLSIEGNKQVDISKATGISKPLISMFLDKKGQKDLQFSNSFAIIRYIEKEDYLDVMDDYCRTLTKPIGILSSLEYASNFNRRDLLDDLLSVHQDHKGEVKEWIEIYRFERDKDLLTSEMAWERCRSLFGKVTIPEALLKLELIESTLTFKQNFYDMNNFLARTDRKVHVLREGFLKDSLLLKYDLQRAYDSLYNRIDIQDAIQNANNILKSPLASDFIVASANHLLGHAYQGHSVDLAIRYLEMAQACYKKANSKKHEEMEQDIAFVLSIHNVIHDRCLSCGDEEEVAHQHYVRGEVNKAIRLLKNQSQLSPFGKLYLGLCTKNVHQVFEGYGEMKQSGNNYFATFFTTKLDSIIRGVGV